MKETSQNAGLPCKSFEELDECSMNLSSRALQNTVLLSDAKKATNSPLDYA